MNYFVSGIDTNIGKTIVSAVLVEALEADYWKPIQSGDLEHSDTMKVKALVSNSTSVFHPERFRLNKPASPHLAAKIDGINISIDDFRQPVTENTLIIEGAGGIMVPINKEGNTILDLMTYCDAEIILVSKHYLGSINHTLLSLNVLKSKGLKVKGVIFIGDEHEPTESIIKNISNIPVLGRIPILEKLDKSSIKEVAKHFKFLKD